MAEVPVRLGDLIEHIQRTHPASEPLEQVAAAVAAAAYVGRVADQLIGHFVDGARRGGASWTDIGSALGVSRQAAQQRFVPRDSEDPDFPAGGRLSRFTPRARQVLKEARAAARRHHDERIEPEHLLLGLLSEPEGLAARALVALGAPLEQVRDAVNTQLGRPARRSRPQLARFGRGAKKTVELALREALRLGHNYIGTEHLLLGLLRGEREQAARLLVDLGVTHERVTTWVTAELDRLRTH